MVSPTRMPPRRFDAPRTGGLTPIALRATPELRVPLPRSSSSTVTETVDGAGLMARLNGNWAAKAVVLGAGTVGALGGLMAATPAHAATIDISPSDARAAAKYKGVVYLGMNDGSSHEVSSLRQRLGHNGVKYIGPSAEQDKILYDGAKYDLTTEEGRDGFVAALGITGDRAEALESLLENQGQKGRDELAKLVVVFDQAEHGDRFIERIVFSGHSVGSSVWGDDNGTLRWDTLGKLAAVFPKAGGQVEDVLIAACYSGGQNTMDKYRAIFPNVKTIWAYDGSAPGAWSGAVPHILRWESGTRGLGNDSLKRDVAEHTRKGENVAVWSEAKGYDNGDPLRPIATDRASYTTSSAVVPGFLDGSQTQASTQSGPLRSHYNDIQRMLSRPDLPAAERTQLETERDQVIRLIYYGNVSSFFSLVHGPAIEQGFSDLGLETPDFSKLSRAEGMAKVKEFSDKLAATENPSESATYLGTLLESGLRDLSSEHVPESWI